MTNGKTKARPKAINNYQDIHNNELPSLALSIVEADSGFTTSTTYLESKGYSIDEAAHGMNFLIRMHKKMIANKKKSKKPGKFDDPLRGVG